MKIQWDEVVDTLLVAQKLKRYHEFVKNNIPIKYKDNEVILISANTVSVKRDQSVIRLVGNKV